MPEQSPQPVRLPALITVVAVLLLASISFWLLRELAPVIRPLLLAVILAYIVMPYHSRLRKHVGSMASLVLLAAAMIGVLLTIAVAFQIGINGMSADWPNFQVKINKARLALKEFAGEHAPGLMNDAENPVADRIGELAALAAQ